jgi:uncharacterized protein YjbJ (UPF0337 family)
MGAKTDQVKGHAKEATGTLTGNKDLESKGKGDRQAGVAKAKLGHAEDKAEELVDKVKDALDRK